MATGIAIIPLVHGSFELVVLYESRRAQELQQDMQLPLSDAAAAEAFSGIGTALHGAKVQWKPVCLQDAVQLSV